tara:strand:+ start:217 stop:732 length:516 start_codon:yes stop_codon:yes gene_type:complete
MIKQAEINAAYQQGVHAALIKLSNETVSAGAEYLAEKLEEQNQLRKAIGLGGGGFLADTPTGGSDYNPLRLATMQNLSRAGMLGGAGVGTYLGGMDPRAAALASAGALGGGMIGANLGQGVGSAIDAWRGDQDDSILARPAPLSADTTRKLVQIGGAIGGSAGGAAAGYYS